MRILIVNKKQDRVYLSSLMERLFENRKRVLMNGFLISFDVENACEFFHYVWSVYAEFSRDSRGQMIRQRRFFRVEDYPQTFWYELSGDYKAVMYGWV